jgi:LmbE family N-acetylglucosaminyl deacetylase
LRPGYIENHPSPMIFAYFRRSFQRYSRFALFLALLLPAIAQETSKSASPVDPLPQDTDASGLTQMLRKLQTTARLQQVVAHPDDEDGGMLTLEARGKGATVTLQTLTRGEGGQNKVGSNLFDVLGVLRTLELTAADRYYGATQRFARVADFGYSKTPEETFQKWQGHDVALGDVVRVIRTFRPDVLTARFSGTDRDGHGHHQASSLLAQEAFRAAGDPKRFPEQIKEGLPAWQAKKVYIGNVCSFGAQSCPDKDYTLRLNTGVPDPVLGMSYVQFAIEGLKHQESQGLGNISAPSGARYTFYRLVDSTLPSAAGADGHEKDFFDGIDTALPGLAARLGGKERKAAWLRPALVEVASHIKDAVTASEKDPESAAAPVLAALGGLSEAVTKLDQAGLKSAEEQDVLDRLREKLQQAESALNLALGVSLEATVLPTTGPGAGPESDGLSLVSPGQSLAIRVRLHNGSKQALRPDEISIEGFGKPMTLADARPIQPGQNFDSLFRAQVPADFPSTKPYWHRNDPEEDAINTVDNPKYATLPFPPVPFHAAARYRVGSNAGGSRAEGQVTTAVTAQFRDDKGTEERRTLMVAPAYSVMLEPGEQIIPTSNGSASGVTVQVSSNLAEAPAGSLHLESPSGWRVEPRELPVELHRRGESKEYKFQIFPANLKESRAEIRAVLEAGGRKFSEGYSVVTRPDIATFYYYQPAVQRVSIVDVKVPHDLKVGYIMGAGDDIPTVLQQVGMNVTLIPSEKLAGEDLSRYGTLVLGIRAYDTQKDVAANNKKLLDFVSAGGTLVEQYNTGVSDFNGGHFTPYPATLSRDRVSVEEAPVQILAPADSVFHSPNEITQHDFDGWVQERGLYFMDSWDDHFKPLVASNDPGESAQKGGLLRAQYGKGTYIYAAYAFFRQLPAGVPGAIRLYVNLLNAGH